MESRSAGTHREIGRTLEPAFLMTPSDGRDRSARTGSRAPDAFPEWITLLTPEPSANLATSVVATASATWSHVSQSPTE